MGLRTRFLIAHVVFLFSGVSGLGYQAIWARWLGLGLGQELPAVLASVGACFGGFALGAAALDRALHRSRDPALWYAGLEGLVGAWAVLGLLLIPAANDFARLWMGIEPTAWRQTAVAFGVPFLVLLPASAAMGATFPAMERFARGLSADGRVIGSLYAAQTAGAALGAIGCAFWLLPAWGFATTTVLLALLNLTCAAVILLLRVGRTDLPHETRYEPERGRPRPRSLPHQRALAPRTRPSALRDSRFMATEQVQKEQGTSHEPSGWRLRITLLASGLLGIGLEVLGVRVLKMVLENTVFTFACLLAIYLVGTAIGALLVERFLGHVPRVRRLNWLLGGLAFGCALSGVALSGSLDLNGWLRRSVGLSSGGVVLAECLVAASVFLVPALLMGATFTTLVESARNAWGSVGRALAWNTLGGALAPWVVGWFLFPRLGAKWTLVTLIAGYVLLRPQPVARPGLVASGLALATCLLLPDLRLILLRGDERLVAVREGASDTVAVVETPAGHRVLRVNNRFTMGGTASVVAERRQAHIPLLLHPHPARALFLGSGTGITAAAGTLHPGLEVHSVELVPDVVALQGEFAPENEGGLGRLRQYVADARRFVRATTNRYDVIVADLFHPGRDGAGGLYTREHYQAIGRCLATGGLFCQWLPLYQLDLPSVGWVIGSMKQTFPKVRGFLLRATVETPVLGLVGSMAPLALAEAGVSDKPRGLPFQDALREAGLTDAVQLFGWELFDDAGELSQFSLPDTDDRLAVNFRAAWRLPAARQPPDATLFELIELTRAAAGRAAAPGPPPGRAARIRRFREARDAYLVGLRWEVAKAPDKARAAFVESARLSEDFTTGYAHAITLAVQMAPDRADDARRLLEQLVQARPEQPVARELLRRLFTAGQADPAP